MYVPNEIASQVAPTLFKWVLGTALTGLLTVMLWPIRKARKEWVSLKDNLESTRNELVHQRTNCLTTLQAQGATQIELLTKTVAALDGVKLELAEQTGYLKASLAVPPSRRRAAAAKR